MNARAIAMRGFASIRTAGAFACSIARQSYRRAFATRAAACATRSIVTILFALSATLPAPPFTAALAAQETHTISVDALLDSIAVNTHINYTDGAYADVRKVSDDLAWAGIRHVREGTPADSIPLSSYLWLAQHGVKFTFVIRGDVTESLRQLDRFAAIAPESIAAVEGLNEIDNFPVSYDGLKGDAAGLAAQQAIYAHVHGNASLKGVPVYDLTGYKIAHVDTRARAADFANHHVYPQNGDQPAYNASGAFWMAWAINSVRKYQLPIVLTEFGYFSSPQAGWNSLGVDEATQAKGVLNGLFDAASLGVTRTYLYELLDEKPDPQYANNEMHYGLFRYDNTPKPAAKAIRNLNAILRASAASASAGAGPSNDSASCVLSGMPESTRSLLLTRSDGHYFIALWNEVPFWDRATGKPLNAPPVSVQVDLGAKASRVALYDPTVSAGPLATHANLQRLAVEVPDHVVLLEVTLAGALGANGTAS